MTQLTPVLPVTWPARWNGRGGLLKMLVRNCFSMLGVAHRGQRVLVISDTTRVSLISQAERRTLSSYDINTLMHCINPKPVAKYRRSACGALGKLGDHYPGADGREREREQTHFLRSLQWQYSSDSRHVQLEECVEHIRDARDVIQRHAVRVQPRDHGELHERKRGPLDGGPRFSLDMSMAATSSPCTACPGPCSLQLTQRTGQAPKSCP